MPMFFVLENKSGYLRSVFLLFPVQCAYQLIDDLFRTHRAKNQIQAVDGICLEKDLCLAEFHSCDRLVQVEELYRQIIEIRNILECRFIRRADGILEQIHVLDPMHTFTRPAHIDRITDETMICSTGNEVSDTWILLISR